MKRIPIFEANHTRLKKVCLGVATERAFEIFLRIVARDDDANLYHVLCFTQSWNFAPTKTGTLTLTITGTLANATMSRTLMLPLRGGDAEQEALRGSAKLTGNYFSRKGKVGLFETSLPVLPVFGYACMPQSCVTCTADDVSSLSTQRAKVALRARAKEERSSYDALFKFLMLTKT